MPWAYGAYDVRSGAPPRLVIWQQVANGASEGDMERDPVCGMELMPGKEEAEFQYQGKTYRFCSRECRDLFAKNPTEYLKAESGA